MPTRAPKPPADPIKMERFPRAQCDEAYDLWCLKRGAIHYGRFRNAFASVWPAREHAVNLQALEWAIAFTHERASIETMASVWRRWCDIATADAEDRAALLAQRMASERWA